MFETCFVVEIVKSIEVMQLAENINYIILLGVSFTSKET